MKIVIDAAKTTGTCPHFWAAIGCDHAHQWTLHPSGDALLGEIKRTQSVRWLRNHYALSDAIEFQGRSVRPYRVEDGETKFDFSAITAVYDRWLAAGVRPIVELDFLPPELRDATKRPLNTPDMWREWGRLLRAFVGHLRDRYGAAEVRQWYFENWNEPDLWPRERIGEFFRLHDEAVAAVESVDPAFRIGGPGALAQPFADLFLHQMHFGTNTLTGEKGSRCDYLSMHAYGASGNTLPYYPALLPRPSDIAARCYWAYELMGVFPGQRAKEFHLNEWGMISHYEKNAYDWPPMEIRNTEHFPLFIFELIDLLFTIADHRGDWLPTIMLLWAGAAEALWSDHDADRKKRYAGRSGLFAGNRSLTTKYNIAKPILRGFELLARLGSIRLRVTGSAAGRSPAAIATHGGGRVQVLVYYFDADPAAQRPDAKVAVGFENLSADGPAWLHVRRIDRQHANSFRAWESLGRPAELSGDALHRVRRASELHAEPPVRVEIRRGRCDVTIELPFPGAALLELESALGSFAAPTELVRPTTFKHRIA